MIKDKSVTIMGDYCATPLWSSKGNINVQDFFERNGSSNINLIERLNAWAKTWNVFYFSLLDQEDLDKNQENKINKLGYNLAVELKEEFFTMEVKYQFNSEEHIIHIN